MIESSSTDTPSTCPSSLEAALTYLQSGHYAFADFGCSFGGSIEYCEKCFNRGKGIGFDNLERKIVKAQENNYHAVTCDLLATDFPSGCVSFVSMMDFLEHLPDLEATRVCIKNAMKMARDFVFVRHPSFEDINYLARLGLKINWTDLAGHTNMLRIEDYQSLFEELSIESYSIYARRPIPNSRHPVIIPLDAPEGSQEYDLEKHGEKVTLGFDRIVYSQFDIFIKLNEEITETDWQRLCAQAQKKKDKTELVLDKRYSRIFDIFNKQKSYAKPV